MNKPCTYQLKNCLQKATISHHKTLAGVKISTVWACENCHQQLKNHV